MTFNGVHMSGRTDRQTSGEMSVEALMNQSVKDHACDSRSLIIIVVVG